MKVSRTSMSMLASINLPDLDKDEKILLTVEEIFNYFDLLDTTFSTYKTVSESILYNQGKILDANFSELFKKVLILGEEAKEMTNGFFDMNMDGKIDPLGLVKGLAIQQGAKMIREVGVKNFCFEIAGDLQTSGKNNGKKWKIGIQNPWNFSEVIKIVFLKGEGMATSGNYIRGEHIYNPKNKFEAININKNSENLLVSVTVIHSDVYYADIFATALFAMGGNAFSFAIEKKLAVYMVYKNKEAQYTKEFLSYTLDC